MPSRKPRWPSHPPERAVVPSGGGARRWCPCRCHHPCGPEWNPQALGKSLLHIGLSPLCSYISPAWMEVSGIPGRREPARLPDPTRWLGWILGHAVFALGSLRDRGCSRGHVPPKLALWAPRGHPSAQGSGFCAGYAGRSALSGGLVEVVMLTGPRGWATVIHTDTSVTSKENPGPQAPRSEPPQGTCPPFCRVHGVGENP